MFAVPGWSVSAAKLKAESIAPPANKGPAANKESKEKPEAAKDNNTDKKRKRPSSGPGGPGGNVTAANLADLYEQVIEGKPKKKKAKGPATGFGLLPKGKQEPAASSNEKGQGTEAAVVRDAENGETPAEAPSSKPSRKEKKKTKKAAQPQQDAETAADDEKPVAQAKAKGAPAKSPKQKQVAAPAQAAPRLTPLQASMREKLISARFRHLNETLYTKPSAQAFHLFEESPEMFQEYHEGFRRQVNVWPENPVDGYVADIIRRGQQPTRGKARGGPPLLRTNGTCTIADLGCGDGKLAENLQAEKKKLRVEPGPHVTRADIANLPLHNGSVNVAIFCLALMGTNWLDFIDEAYRVLHWKGELWIAEIKSRFAPPAKGKKGAVVAHSVGNRQKTALPPKGKLSKEAKAEAHAELETVRNAELAVEVDGMDDRRQETDVSAFVAALQKRGFVLQGEGSDAVDLSNKMFVKMHFIKGAQPTVGKNFVAEQGGRGGPNTRSGARPAAKKEDDDQVDENKILKPCVYKLR
ncbi:rRNA processing protein Rrp8 [Apiospora saccharicola]|uniref:Ribosomal RNA-processing protein 8 n=1 Tax=Apiospora saccharicola TaxID=335842 RepID=A0ABR1ULT8_9PEZI